MLAEKRIEAIQNSTLNLSFDALLKWHDPHISQECSGDIASTKKFLASLREKICSIPVHEDSEEILDEDEEVKMNMKIKL